MTTYARIRYSGDWHKVIAGKTVCGFTVADHDVKSEHPLGDTCPVCTYVATPEESEAIAKGGRCEEDHQPVSAQL